MNFWEKTVAFMATKGEKPIIFGAYHISCIIVAIVAIVLLCVCFRDCKEKTVRKITLIAWLVTLAFEAYKQIFYAGLSMREEQIVWDYGWWNFPFQLCSNTIYLLPFVAFMKDGKVREAIISFLATFSVFGGLTVYAYPSEVFVEQIGITVQTMVHHGVQIVVGVFLLVHRRRNFSLKSFLSAVYVFIVMCVIATVLNEVAYHLLPEFVDGTFNMFYISYHYKCSLPILREFYSGPENPLLPYPLFLMLYVVGFAIVGFIIYSIGWGIYNISSKKSNKGAQDEQL